MNFSSCSSSRRQCVSLLFWALISEQGRYWIQASVLANTENYLPKCSWARICIQIPNTCMGADLYLTLCSNPLQGGKGKEKFPAGITYHAVIVSIQSIQMSHKNRSTASSWQQHISPLVFPQVTHAHIHSSRVFCVWAARPGCLWEEIWSQRVGLPRGSELALSSMSACHASHIHSGPAQCGLSGLLLQPLNTSA